MNRHQLRRLLLFATYEHLLLQEPLALAVFNNLQFKLILSAKQEALEIALNDSEQLKTHRKLLAAIQSFKGDLAADDKLNVESKDSNFRIRHVDEAKITVDPYLLALVKDLNENEAAYIKEITSYLNRWQFTRLNYVDQAILLMARAELKLAENDKAVIIDEAVNLAKEFSDVDAFKYINGVLDKLCAS